MASENRPNVLFVICDQLRADHVGFAGNGVVRTPNIDSIAAGGMVFDQAFVSNPVCMPNRSTIMTGRMPSAHGVVFNDRSLDPMANTFVRQLRNEGWRTALIGKSHLQHGMSRDSHRHFGLAAGHSTALEDGWDTLEHQERYEAGESIRPDDFYGFGHLELTIGHGAMSGGHHYQWALEQGVSHDDLTSGLDPTYDVPDRSEHWWQIHAAPFPEEAYSTAFVTARTIAFIEEAAASDEPWMTWCSFPDPHHPLSPPEPWFSRHDPGDMELPATFHDPGEAWPAHITQTRSHGPLPDGGPGLYVIPFGPNEDQALACIAATYGMIEAIDEGVGKILAALKRTGEADNTIIVFTSDHGDMMGDHGIMLKGFMHFEGCLRVPMVINTPDGNGGRTTSLASSIDLPHTILELCGVAEFQGMQGTSLTPLLGDPSASVRDSVLIEDDFPPAAVGAPVPEKTRTVRTATHRYTRDSTGFEQLFDMANDPGELTNLAPGNQDPTVRVKMLDVLADAMIGADDMTRVEPVSLELSSA